jgi:hypothetical protein
MHSSLEYCNKNNENKSSSSVEASSVHYKKIKDEIPTAEIK